MCEPNIDVLVSVTWRYTKDGGEPVNFDRNWHAEICIISKCCGLLCNLEAVVI